MKCKGQQIPLARWRTTIGGWRAEQASDGYEYYRYKMSDVGPRVIRQVVSGPVWIAPPSTPIRTLVKGKLVNSSWMKVVNYDELGPGYLSAYGIIAGYFVVPGLNGRPDFDNGVRAHGSSDYLSIYSSNGFSHGCHRLPNHLAIRMYSFILRHRKMRVAGDQPMGFTRQFLLGETVYEMRIPSRGYAYYLDPPLPVNVLEGNIMGDQKKPIIGYVPKPGVKYPGPAAARARQPRSQGRRRWRRRASSHDDRVAKTKRWFATAAGLLALGVFLCSWDLIQAAEPAAPAAAPRLRLRRRRRRRRTRCASRSRCGRPR